MDRRAGSSSSGSSNNGNSASTSWFDEAFVEFLAARQQQPQQQAQPQGIQHPQQQAEEDGMKMLPPNACTHCYFAYKAYCEKEGMPYRRIEEGGFWHGHTSHDMEGKAICPQLRKVMCPLCFTTGPDAHVLKLCPLMMKQHLTGIPHPQVTQLPIPEATSPDAIQKLEMS